MASGQITTIPDSGKTAPSLARMIRESRSDQQIIRRATQEALRAWFRQSERLNIARREFRLRGPRFVDFARRIGISDQTSAYQLVHLHRYRAQIISKCVDDASGRRPARTGISLSRLGDGAGLVPQAEAHPAQRPVLAHATRPCIASWKRSSSSTAIRAPTRCRRVTTH